MPSIPGLNYNRGGAPGPVGAPVPNQVTAATQGSELGTGLQTLGHALQQTSDLLYDTYTESKASASIARSQAEIQDYAFKIRYGGMDADGKMTAPEDPEKHQELFQKKVDEVREREWNNLPGKAITMFDRDFTAFSNRQALSVKASALELYSERIKSNLDESLQQDAVTFVEATDIEKPMLQQKVAERIDMMEKRGVLTPHEALQRKKQFIDDAATGSIVKLMRQDPLAVVDAIRNGEFKDLPADKQQQWETRALDQYRINLERENAQEEKAERRARKEQQEFENETAKDLWEKRSKGALEPEEVYANKDNLALDEYKQLMKAARGGSDSQTDPTIYSNLRIAANRGQDVRGEATKHYRQGLLDRTAYDHVVGMVESNSIAVKGENWQEVGKKYIDQYLMPDPNTATGFERKMAADAALEWYKWTKSHPGAKADEAEKVYKSIADRSAGVSTREMLITQPVPRFHEGNRGELDRSALQKIYKKTKKEFEEGRINKSDFEIEKSKIETHLRLIKKRELQKQKEKQNKED